MPLIQSTRRINPLDLNKNVTIGVAFPLDETNMFSGTETMQEQIKANIINLLLTQPGERVNLPNYGVGLRHLLFEQKIDLTILQEKIQTSVSRYIPNVVVTNINTGLSEDEHTLFVSLIYKYMLNGEVDSIQLNFS